MNRFITSCLLMALCCIGYVSAQSFTGDQLKQGYAVMGDKVTFIFDEALYDVTPKKVFVTGEFRGWDASADKKEWFLKKTGQQWLLTIDNTDFAVIKPNTPFKYRVDDGEWLAPAAAAENIQDGNLVFMKKAKGTSFSAALTAQGLIWAEVSQNRPLVADAYRITDATGKVIPVAGVMPNSATSVIIRPVVPLNKKHVYFLEIPAQGLKTNCSFDGWFRDTYSTKELGANVEDGRTTVRLFAPRADSVKLYLYAGRLDKKAYRVVNMVEDHEGVWEYAVQEDLHGVYYDFTVHGADEPGNHFYETTHVHINDPYARVSDDTWGKCRIWHKTTPATPLVHGIPKMQDVIAYEVHVQDFTDQLPVSKKLKGTFKAMTMPGLTNSRGRKIGFDYLVDLGINVVHLMPVQEYVQFPTDDWKASFKDDKYMISQGISEENYQWGYRTSFAMAVESRYRTKGTTPGQERNEFRDLVQAFHDKGIAVIIDMVPNHTAENMDGNSWFFNFNGIDMQYYYRTKDFKHLGAYGNEVKTENRPMTQRWLVDQCKSFINEFGVDGFRIDLAGQVDQQTLTALKAQIGQDKIVYGEAWIGSNDPNYEANPDWDWYKEDAPITFFQDDSRGAYKGPVFELKDKLKDRGWSGGKFSDRPLVMKGLANKFKDDKTPLSGISYLDIHDNFALADQFGGDHFDGRTSVDQDEYKIATTLLYTTLGPIVTHGGSEIMRSKASAPLKEVVKQTKAGFKVYMHGYRDTYNMRKANEFVWKTVGQKPTKHNSNDYDNMLAFWKGLNAFRLSPYGAVFRVADAVPEGYYAWITPQDNSLLGYCVDNKVMVLINAGQKNNAFKEVHFPVGQWRLIATTKAVNYKEGVKGPKKLKQIHGDLTIDVPMAATSLYIWVNTSQDVVKM